MQEIILKLRYFERGLLKRHEKVNFCFLFQTHSFLMDKIMKNKRPGTSDQLLLRLQNKFRKFFY